jgi:hypothetical protein
MRLRMIVVWIAMLTVPAAAQQPPMRVSHEAPEYPGFSNVQDRRALRITPSFSTSIHVDLVENDPAARACTEVLAAAQWRQDILLALDATAHYDNCQFEAATDYVQRLLSEAIAAAVKNEHKAALAALGRALHGIQDFYSHTNYVELAAAQSGKPDEVDIVPVWTSAGRQQLSALVAHGLISGHVWWEPGNICAKPVRSHEDLNKDRPDSVSGREIVWAWKLSRHQAARALALQATRTFLRDAFSRKELRPVAEACNEKVGFLLLTDNREGAR